MIRSTWLTAAVTFVLLSFAAGCDSSNDPAPDTTKETDGRISVNNSEQELAARVTARNQIVAVDTAGLGKRSAPAAFSLTLKYDLAPPTVGGKEVQATSVHMSSTHAHISYNLQGAAYGGAVDILFLLFGGSWGAYPISTASFEGTDVSSIRYDDGYVYLAEATSEAKFDPYTAVMERIKTSLLHTLTVADNKRTPLQSFVATSVGSDETHLYATTGNTGYLYRIDKKSLLPTDSVSLSDARWVDVDDKYVVVMQGTPGRLAVFSKSTLAPVKTISIGGATIPESKSTVQLIGGKALVAAGDGGVKLVDLASGTVVGSLPRVTVSKLDPSVTVTNAVSASGKYVFIANGEAGVYVAEASKDLEESTGSASISLKYVGKLRFDDLQSVNHVAYNGSHLIVASGTGGVKIVRVEF
ncbi:MAG: hypothetical protein F9K22_14630 [Bacteroidetes bacterium]|nr:MAG: hypothetical protein F9K22_14630 [Bacteroidota bacterium]